mgnify:CR=1 FL=1
MLINSATLSMVSGAQGLFNQCLVNRWLMIIWDQMLFRSWPLKAEIQDDYQVLGESLKEELTNYLGNVESHQ